MGEIIKSRQNPQLKAVRALLNKKARYAEGLFRFDGKKLFIECLGKVRIERVFLKYPTDPYIEDLVNKAQADGFLRGGSVIFVEGSAFETITEESSPEGIVTVAAHMRKLHSDVSVSRATQMVDSQDRILLVESVRDAGNLGTIIRTSAALGIDKLIISDDCADLYNPKTIRSSMGGLFRLPILRIENEYMPELVRQLRAEGRRIYAAALSNDAQTVGELILQRGDGFIIGNEGHGLSDALIDAADSCAIIPMIEGNESLNAAAAAAICIWETVRARSADLQ